MSPLKYSTVTPNIAAVRGQMNRKTRKNTGARRPTASLPSPARPHMRGPCELKPISAKKNTMYLSGML
jgi:hypothetical protein